MDLSDERAPRQPRVPVDACSAQWDRGDLPAWGTAAWATFWMALEQPGPWGHDAFASSHLDPVIGKALEAAVAGAGGRALLIRRPGRRGDTRARRPRQVFLATGIATGRPTLLGGRIEDPSALLDVPWAAIADGEPPAQSLSSRRSAEPVVHELSAEPESVLLVCTNAKRDVCCALRGIPLARALHRHFEDRVWECSHTGGHRFAPTGVLLPSGATLGRLDAALGAAALAAPVTHLASEVLDPRVLRGMAHRDPIDQAVDAWARTRWHLADLSRPVDIRWEPDTAVPAGPSRGRRVAVVQAPPMPAARLEVTERLDPAPRSVSCGRDPGPSTSVQITEITEITAD